ncbi:MAG: tRNA (adenosine(37)-N6)-threonylcarbamoyltransferase complex ATPase subunit type 1 TsaE [Syntrophobacteraceae bacterium]|jgi:tRNA threonylcarbamoyladenosine biosynthesis protein TsaE
MKEFLFHSPGEECSLLLGRSIGELLQAGDILALWGELAAGKTLLTQGIAGGLGVAPEVRVTSPTFTIINEHSGRVHLYHIDLYRISGPDELETLPWQESLFGNGVAVIEWPDRLGRLLPAERWDIKFSIIGEESRDLLLCGRGRKNRARMAKWVEKLKNVQLEAVCAGR